LGSETWRSGELRNRNKNKRIQGAYRKHHEERGEVLIYQLGEREG
jgi:hypothetical protein